MTEQEWTELIRAGRQAEYQAREILAMQQVSCLARGQCGNFPRPRAACERGTLQETWRAWAVAVLSGATLRAGDGPHLTPAPSLPPMTAHGAADA